MDPTYPLVPVANLVACILILLSLLTGFTRRSWNVGVMSFALWVTVLCLITSIDTFVWYNNSTIKLEVWCDIATHIEIGSNIGIPACSFAITRKLFKITHLRRAVQSRRERNIELCIDLGLCVGLPILEMVLYYIVQGVRFQVWEEIGCGAATIPSVLSILLINVLPVLLPAFSALFYCPRILWTFYRHRKEANEFLSSSASIGRKIYFRFLILGCVDAIIFFPLAILNLVILYGFTTQPGDDVFYPGWTLVHSDWAPVSAPASAWKSYVWNVFSVKWSEWINVFCGVLFFFIFGVTAEAKESYKRVFWAAASRLGYSQPVQVRLSDVVFQSGVVSNADSTQSEGEGESHSSDPEKSGKLDIEKGLGQTGVQDESLLQSSVYNHSSEGSGALVPHKTDIYDGDNISMYQT